MSENEKVMNELISKLSDNTLSNCFKMMNPKVIEYVEGKSMTMEYPVLDVFLNSRGSMQGGFITAAFDNTFGALGILSAGQQEIASIDLSVSFQRPVFPDNGFKVTVYMKHQGNTIMHLTGEAHDNKGKLLASSSTNIMILDKDKFYRK